MIFVDTGSDDFDIDLAVQVRAELEIIRSINMNGELDEPIEDWRFDPTEAQLYEAGLCNLLGAAEGLHDDDTDAAGPYPD